MTEIIWGYQVRKCAWCLTKTATKSYIGQQAGGELAEYKVCSKCYKDMA